MSKESRAKGLFPKSACFIQTRRTVDPASLRRRLLNRRALRVCARPAGSGFQLRRRWQRRSGQPRSADRPRQTTPISPSPALGSTPTRPRPRPAATAPSGSSRLCSQAALGGGRKAVPRWVLGQKLQDPKAFAAEARPPPPTTRGASAASSNESRAREKGRPGPDAP